MVVPSEIFHLNIILVLLNVGYVFLIMDDVSKPMAAWTEKFIITRDSMSAWNETLAFSLGGGRGRSRSRARGSMDLGGSEEWERMADYDDDKYDHDDYGHEEEEDLSPIVPSTKYRCPPHPPDWLTIRAQANYKYFWLHGNEDGWLSATATMDTPLHHRAFEVVPVTPDCSDGGWVRLRETDSKYFLRMVPPPPPQPSVTDGEQEQLKQWQAELPRDLWAVHTGDGKDKAGGSLSMTDTAVDQSFHWLLEEDGYLLNRGASAFANVITASNDARVRGHASYSKHPAHREFTAMVRFAFVNESAVQASRLKESTEAQEARDQDSQLLQQIQGFPSSKEKRVISFGLYGTNEKYTVGAVRNAELAKRYFPGWVCRFYCSEDVPLSIKADLEALGAEVAAVPRGKGYVSGMFWRFLVASDDSVDRFIVRDTDSRLNSRDAMAVQDWIKQSEKYPVHTMRDHVNHCHTMNGGMWGATKAAGLGDMRVMVEKWENRDVYLSDMNFLNDEVWPLIKDKQLGHDSYCCSMYLNTVPFPSRRPPTYQHVGQVFSADDEPRLMDIDGVIRGVPTPQACRKDPEWIYG